jgi:L-ribulose-5-phosphate 3-epimerase
MALVLGTATYKYLWAYPLDEALRRIAATGLRHVELMTTPPHVWIREMDAEACARLRDTFEQYHLTPCSLNPTFLDISIASTNPGIRQESTRQIVEPVNVAGAIGAGIVVLSAGKTHPLLAPTLDVSLKLIKESLLPILEICEAREVTIAIENSWNLIDRSALLVQLIEEVNHARLKIAYDLANANVVEDAVSGLDRAKAHLVHLHLSDSRPGIRAHDPIGKGTLDYAVIAKKLKEIDYRGLSVLEIIDRADCDTGIQESIGLLSRYGWEL